MREFVQLANTYQPAKHFVGNWYVSEKLDGMRCFWDGGITRGILKDQIPWANTAKDERLIDPEISTGLWTRNANVIHAPDWWLDQLPEYTLDGELYAIGTLRQSIMSIVKRKNPNNDDWQNIIYCVFDSPTYNLIFQSGEIKSLHYQKTFVWNDIYRYLQNLNRDLTMRNYGSRRFNWIINSENGVENDIVQVIDQEQLPLSEHDYGRVIQRWEDKVLSNGGEGLMLRSNTIWVPKRTRNLLKVKKAEEDEGTVVGYISGRKTDKGSKLLGMLGALILDYKGRRLELSGFTDEERSLDGPDAYEWARNNPGQECPDWIQSNYFPIGSQITFKYRGKSKDGIPNEARYHRERPNE